MMNNELTNTKKELIRAKDKLSEYLGRNEENNYKIQNS